jgi:hypothetical protein
MMIGNNLPAFLLLAMASTSTNAFVPARFANLQRSATLNPIKAATLEPLTVGKDEPTTWECDDDLTECKEVLACDEEVCRTSLDVRIHGDWYDLSG